MEHGSKEGRGRRSTPRMGVAPNPRASSSGAHEAARAVELETLLEKHSEGMLVRTGLTCRHGFFPILCCCWSGPDTGRRFLACSQVEQPCDFKYWIDEHFEGRAKRVIQDLVSMRHSMSELYEHSARQWDDMYADRQRAKQQIHELKCTIRKQRE